MLDSIYHMALKVILKIAIFGVKESRISSLLRNVIMIVFAKLY